MSVRVGRWALVASVASFVMSAGAPRVFAAGTSHTIESGAAKLDFQAATAEVEGAGAADRHAPSADIARVKAERTARLVAARRLHASLAALSSERLGCAGGLPTLEAVSKATETARATRIEYASDGSVSLTLAVPFASLVAAADAGATNGASATTGAILVDASAHPTVLRSRTGGGCEGAPRFFDTLAEARAAGGDLASAPVVDARTKPAPGAAPPRIVAIVKHGDTHTKGAAK